MKKKLQQKELVGLEVQENNIDLSDFKIPKIYINGEWIEFPDYRINYLGTAVYSVKQNKYLKIRYKHGCASAYVQLYDIYGKSHTCAVISLVWFTFEHDSFDFSECKTLYYKYKYYPRYLINNNGTIIFDTKTRKILSQSLYICKNGKKYLQARIVLDKGVIASILVHRLVKWTFTGGPETEIKNPIDPTIDHRWGDGLNNDINNLRWVERGLNTSMGVSGSKHGNAVINENIARQICVALKYENESVTILDIANTFNVSAGVIYHIYVGNNWKGISMQYAPFPRRHQK